VHRIFDQGTKVPYKLFDANHTKEVIIHQAEGTPYTKCKF